jgi:DNA invertase Pin-like site-specific DNA recombinase
MTARPNATHAGATCAIAYCRTAAGGQREAENGLQAQEQRCRSWATAHGVEVVAVYVDAATSGLTRTAPGLQAALDQLTPGSVLLVQRPDRLTRSAEQLRDLDDRIRAVGATWRAVDRDAEPGA